MHITDIKIIRTENNSRKLADVSIVIDDELLITNIKLIDNGKRMFIAFSETKRKQANDEYSKEYPDVIPLYSYVRNYIEEQIINKYMEMEEQQGKESEEL
jgi:DNA-binding cell septation regulator SpoVG